jgi:hypothetical protein
MRLIPLLPVFYQHCRWQTVTSMTIHTKRVGVVAKGTYFAWEKVELGKAQMQYMYVAHKLVTDNNVE